MNGLVKALNAAQQRLPKPTKLALAALLDVPLNSLATWSKGSHFPRPYIMARIVERLNLTSKERKRALEAYFEVKDLNALSIMVPDEDLERAEEVAEAFHIWYERVAPDYGYETRAETAVPWEAVPEANRRLMVRVVRELMQQGIIVVPTR
jgi:hypothetical protein